MHSGEILYSRGMGKRTPSATRATRAIAAPDPVHETGRSYMIYLRPSLIEKIDAEARRRGVSRSSMIAAWIERAKWGEG